MGPSLMVISETCSACYSSCMMVSKEDPEEQGNPLGANNALMLLQFIVSVLQGDHASKLCNPV